MERPGFESPLCAMSTNRSLSATIRRYLWTGAGFFIEVGAACGPACPSDAQPTNGTWFIAVEVAGVVCEKLHGPPHKADKTARLANKRRCFFMG
jgi:hypothetical protein